MRDPVLVLGETGTGKELVAQALHEASARAKAPFVVVDCGALAESLIESELFGHVRGAFTGAVDNRMGAFESADGGTVFLDEVGELPLRSQAKLLRVLEAQTIRRVGQNQTRPIDVRVICATHRDLSQMASVGTFREDLYFRIAVLPLVVPPLRDRLEDVPILVRHFAAEDTPLETILAAQREAQARTFPGNVRELRGFVRRMAALGHLAADPPLRSMAHPATLPEASIATPFKELRQAWLDHLERSFMTQMLAEHGRSLKAIAEASGLDRSHVHRLLTKHEL